LPIAIKLALSSANIPAQALVWALPKHFNTEM
jgi:hypothetical protein